MKQISNIQIRKLIFKVLLFGGIVLFVIFFLPVKIIAKTECIREDCNIQLSSKIGLVGMSDEQVKEVESVLQNAWKESMTGRYLCDLDLEFELETFESCEAAAAGGYHCIQTVETLPRDENGKESLAYRVFDNSNYVIFIWESYDGVIREILSHEIGHILGLEDDLNNVQTEYSSGLMGQNVDSNSPNSTHVDSVVQFNCKGEKGLCPSSCSCGNGVIDVDSLVKEECDPFASPMGCSESSECTDKCICESELEIVTEEEDVDDSDDVSSEPTSIDTSGWGDLSGIDASENVPAKGRLVSGYVIRKRDFVISGKAEEGGFVEVYVDSQKVGDTKVTVKECSGSTRVYEDIYTSLCRWEYNLRLGATEKAYSIQVRVVDPSGNVSFVAKGVTITYDKTAPRAPRIKAAEDFWNEDGLGNITNKQLINIVNEAEKYSDVELWLVHPEGGADYVFTKRLDGVLWSNNLNLGAEDVTGDGVYTIKVKSTDAAGNSSALLQFTVEKDTVHPAKPVLSNAYICNSSICLDVTGEANAKVLINDEYMGKASGSSQQYVVLTDWSYNKKYKFTVYIQDRALHLSLPAVKNKRFRS